MKAGKGSRLWHRAYRACGGIAYAARCAARKLLARGGPALHELHNVLCRNAWPSTLSLHAPLALDAAHRALLTPACGQHGALETVLVT